MHTEVCSYIALASAHQQHIQYTFYKFSDTAMTVPWNHTFGAIIAGPSRAGKSTFLAKLLKFRNEMIIPSPDKVYYCYSEWQLLYETECFSDVEFHHGELCIDVLNKEENNLVIYDDLLSECSENIEMMFTKYSHHRNTSVIFITQNIFQKNKYMRTMSLNASYLVLFKNPRDIKQIQYLSSQMYPKKSNFLVESFDDATSKPFGYLMIDLCQQTPEELRVRTGIFPDEKTYIYIPKQKTKSLERYVVNKKDHE